MSPGIRVGFHGVRGSTPCEGPQYARYGGHSSCVSLEAEGRTPILFDLGTGLRAFGDTIAGTFNGTTLLSHLHWDHVQGLPFFQPLHRDGTVLDVYGPCQDEGPLATVFENIMRPPYFPVRPTELTGHVRFHDLGDHDFTIGDARVKARWIRHVGPTLGFRVEWRGVSVAYVPDHGPGCCPDDPDDLVPDSVCELADGVDLLIHDAQHTPEEWGVRRHWGHCTVDYAVHVARECAAQRLMLFHHDPAHGDDTLDLIAQEAAEHSARAGGAEVMIAYEGLALDLRPRTGVNGGLSDAHVGLAAERVPAGIEIDAREPHEAKGSAFHDDVLIVAPLVPPSPLATVGRPGPAAAE